jgi:hypothetical protein
MSQEDHQQTRRHFDVVAEGLRSDMRFLAEGLATTNETLERFRTDTTREFAEVHRELDVFREATARNFADVHAEIRNSHSDIDRRLKAVESR